MLLIICCQTSLRCAVAGTGLESFSDGRLRWATFPKNKRRQPAHAFSQTQWDEEVCKMTKKPREAGVKANLPVEHMYCLLRPQSSHRFFFVNYLGSHTSENNTKQKTCFAADHTMSMSRKRIKKQSSERTHFPGCILIGCVGSPRR